jgi:dUTP pyrophosphatase
MFGQEERPSVVPTGVAVAIPDGYVGYTNPRSGLAHRLGVTIANAPGTIDSGYRGEIKINLVNLDPDRTAVIERGDRIAQLVIQPVVRARFAEVDELAPTQRGSGGHGSTGGHRRLAEENERV